MGRSVLHEVDEAGRRIGVELNTLIELNFGAHTAYKLSLLAVHISQDPHLSGRFDDLLSHPYKLNQIAIELQQRWRFNPLSVNLTGQQILHFFLQILGGSLLRQINEVLFITSDRVSFVPELVFIQ